MECLHPNDPKVSRSVSQSIFTEILNSTNFRITLAEKNNSIVGSCYINVIPNLTLAYGSKEGRAFDIRRVNLSGFLYGEKSKQI